MKIGSKLKKLRNDLGLSQQQLAEKLSVSQDTVSLWENDKSLPATEYLPQLADIFDVSIDFLLDRKKEL